MQTELKPLENFHSRKAKFNFARRQFARLEASLKVLAQTEPNPQAHEFLVKYLKFRASTQADVRRREVATRFGEGDLSALLFDLEAPAQAKRLGFMAMVFGKELSKHSDTARGCELKGVFSGEGWTGLH